MRQQIKTQLRYGIAAGICATAILAAPLVQAGSLEKKNVAADTKWLLHLDVDALLKSKVGSYVHEEVLEPKMKQQRNLLEGMFGVSLKPDMVHSVTIYGTSFEKEPQLHAVAMVRTDIDISGIVKKVIEFQNLGDSASGSNSGDKIKSLQSKPFPLYWMKGEKGEDVYFGNPSGNLWLLTLNREKLDNAVSVIQGKSLNIESGSDLKNISSSNQSVLFLAMAKGFNESAPLPPQAQILKMAENASMTLGESGEFLQAQLSMSAQTTEAAAQMAQLAQGMIALVTLSQSENPDALELARNAKVTQEKTNVSLTVKYPISKALNKIKEETR